MKKVFFILCMLSAVSAQNAWFWQNPWPQGNNLNDIYVFDEGKAAAIGDFGTIIGINNFGSDFNVTHNSGGSNANLHSIFFINPDTGWAAGTSYLNYEICSVVLKTIDGGCNWSLCFENSEYEFKDIYFIDSSIGYMVCNTVVWWGFAGSAFVFKTIDGGLTWALLSESLADGFYNSLYFLSADTGWAVGGYGDDEDFYGWISKTIDGGQTWSKNQKGNGSFESVHFTNSNTGWIVGLGGCFSTTDQGISWHDFVLTNMHNPNEVYFVDQNNGWILDQKWYSDILHTEIWRTVDTGSTWTKLPVDSTLHISSIDFVDTKHGWGTGPAGSMCFTNDGGESWSAVSNSVIFDWIETIQFYNSQIGWLLGGDKILKTYNGGTSWDNLTWGTYFGLNDLNFINEKIGWAVTGLGLVLNTVDGGNTWEVQYENRADEFGAVSFVDSLYGWLLEEDGKIYNTINGGVNWDIQFNKDYSFHSVYFCNKNYGWVTGVKPDQRGLLLKTSNGGITWTEQVFDTTHAFSSVCFIDTLHGWVAGYNGIIMQTADAGSTWNIQHYNKNEAFSRIFFIDLNNGWAAGWDGLVYATENGGKEWHKQEINTSHLLWDVFFIDSNAGWIVGENGTILKTTTGGITWIEEKNSTLSAVPADFKLFQNYPNPFNSVTAISYKLSAASNVALSIYNILGQKVTTLVDKKQPAGTYTVEWNAAGFASGIYFYRLQTESGFVQTRKLLLQK